MATSETQKKSAAKARGIMAQLQEMEHNSRNNVERLAQLWLEMEEEVGHKDLAGQMDELLGVQNKFQDSITRLIEDIDIHCNRIEQEAA